MRKQPPSSRSSLQAELLAVTENCTLARCSSDECPLCLLARMPRPKRHAWLTALTQSELEFLATYHRVCTKLQSSPAIAPAPKSGHGPSAHRTNTPRP